MINTYPMENRADLNAAYSQAKKYAVIGVIVSFLAVVIATLLLNSYADKLPESVLAVIIIALVAVVILVNIFLTSLAKLKINSVKIVEQLSKQASYANKVEDGEVKLFSVQSTDLLYGRESFILNLLYFFGVIFCLICFVVVWACINSTIQNPEENPARDLALQIGPMFILAVLPALLIYFTCKQKILIKEEYKKSPYFPHKGIKISQKSISFIPPILNDACRKYMMLNNLLELVVNWEDIIKIAVCRGTSTTRHAGSQPYYAFQLSDKMKNLDFYNKMNFGWMYVYRNAFYGQETEIIKAIQERTNCELVIVDKIN